MKMSGIYKIQSKIKPERCYIGSAVDMKSRWRIHKHHLRTGKHHSTKLQRHFNKYRECDLIFTMIEPCFSQFLVIREQYYIDKLNPYFNISPTAGSQLGMKCSELTIQKIKQARKNQVNTRKGVPHSEETKHLLRELRKTQNPWPKGSHHSEETKKKYSQDRMGKFPTKETREKMSKSHMGLNTWMKGRRDSDEVRKKKSESRLAYFAKIKLEKELKNA